MNDSAAQSVRKPPPVCPNLRWPLTPDQLPEDPQFSDVFIESTNARRPSAADWAVLAEYMGRYRHLGLTVNSYGGCVRNLDFLADFRWLTSLEIEAYDLESYNGLRHVPGLQNLGLEETKKQLSLDVLQRLPELTSLGIAANPGVEVVSTLPKLRMLVLDKIKRDDVDFLAGAAQLGAIYLRHGGYKDLSALTGLPKLQILSSYRTKFTDLAPISGCTKLGYLRLAALPALTLPDLSALAELQVLEIDMSKGPDDLHAVAHAPNLRYLAIYSGTLQPEQFTVLISHPTLEHIDPGLKTSRLTDQVIAMLGLPADPHNVYRTDFFRQLRVNVMAQT